jgi:hypothetical protein
MKDKIENNIIIIKKESILNVENGKINKKNQMKKKSDTHAYALKKKHISDNTLPVVFGF